MEFCPLPPYHLPPPPNFVQQPRHQKIFREIFRRSRSYKPTLSDSPSAPPLAGLSRRLALTLRRIRLVWILILNLSSSSIFAHRFALLLLGKLKHNYQFHLLLPALILPTQKALFF